MKSKETIQVRSPDTASTAIDRAVLNNPTVIMLCALLLRILVGYHPHSGFNDPPRYGDFEAQRHWLEVTVNIPLHEWYQNTSDNNLLYWGLGKIQVRFTQMNLQLRLSTSYCVCFLDLWKACTG